jgi:MSHA pilin protein MshD
MIELLMFIIIVGIAVAGVLGILNITTRSSADPQLRKQALAIAEGLLEEVQLARFTYCDPSDATAETATGAFITGAAGTVGVGCTTTVEAVGPATGVRPYNNVNDYVTKFHTAEPAFDNASGVLSDAAVNPIAATGAYVATLTITPEALNGIASSDAPLNMNVLRISVNVSYGGGSDVITLEGYRARYAPNAIP